MYSQKNEDDCVVEHFKKKSNGIVMEIGAFKHDFISNSKALIEKEWKAYLIDASPFCITNLFEAYKDNSNVNIIQAIVLNKENEDLTSFYEYPFSATSSISKNHTKKYFSHISEEEFEKNSKEIFIKSISLNSLLKFVINREKNIDFLSIDVEGNSAELAMSLDFNLVKPECICIEHDNRKNDLLNYYSEYYDLKIQNVENVVFFKKQNA
jgi:FkbM family methyltransferase